MSGFSCVRIQCECCFTNEIRGLVYKMDLCVWVTQKTMQVVIYKNLTLTWKCSYLYVKSKFKPHTVGDFPACYVGSLGYTYTCGELCFMNLM